MLNHTGVLAVVSVCFALPQRKCVDLGICCDFKIVTWFLLSRRLACWLLLFAFSWKSASLPGVCPNPLTLLVYTPLQLTSVRERQETLRYGYVCQCCYNILADLMSTIVLQTKFLAGLQVVKLQTDGCVCVCAMWKGKKRSGGTTVDQNLRIPLRIVCPLLFLRT